MSPGADIRSEREARAILKLAPDAPPSSWRAAFQREVKAAHPDRGGDSERVRLVIEAYRFLKTRDPSAARPEPGGTRREPPPRPSPARAEPRPRPQPASRTAPPPEPEPAPEAREQRLRISIVEAFRGAEKVVRPGGGGKFKVRLPGGLQSEDVVRFGAAGEHRVTIEVAALPGATLKGGDLWLAVKVSPEFAREGGRVEVETPLGPRKFWVSRTSAARRLYRAPGEGLPARGARPRGHLYLQFEVDESLAESPSKSLLARFARAWAAA